MADVDLISFKRCSACEATKPTYDFYKASCCKDGLRGECKACVSSKQAVYNKNNAEKISSKKKESYYDNDLAPARQKKSAAYYQEHKDRIKRRSRERSKIKAAQISEHRKANRASLRSKTMAWRSLNRDRVREASRSWYRKNRDRLRPARKAAKAMRRAAGTVDAGIVSFLMKFQLGKCPVCKTSLAGNNYHLDHIKPLAKGGTNHRTNLQLLCPPCNLSKSAKDPIDFMQSRGFLL